MLKLEAGYRVFYWDELLGCGRPEARRYATVIAITDDPNYPVRLTSLVPLGPNQEVQLVSPHFHDGFRKLKDFVLVPGCTKAASAQDLIDQAYATTYADIKKAYPDKIHLLNVPK